MTEQNPGGWPDPQRPGVPMHPERDGWCWLSYSLPRIPQVAPSCFRWSANHDAWMVNNSPIQPATMASLGWHFVARVLAPTEVAAREVGAERRGIERAAQKCDDLARFAARGGPYRCDTINGALWYGREQYATECAAAIRALLTENKQ